ncbi:MAG: alpha-glucosidase/alpha-galactosidase [Opitutales bacterium]|nr:alpha-glucosidase/alpha-galactosidase [Opitutales bacterium]
MKKIAIIGAGSVVFAKKLIGDILQFDALSNSLISLMDIDSGRLKVAEVMTRKIIAKLGIHASVQASLDRTQAIKGADFVICMIQVGGFEPGTMTDFEIPKKYGLQQTIGDTLGVGGVFRALRTIPELLKIAQDIEKVGNPGCLFLNYSNPMAMNCWAVDRGVGVPHVGLCHSVQGTSKQLAAYCNIPYEELEYTVAGINHMAFFLKFAHRGKDAYPLLFKMMEEPFIFKQNKVRFEMMKRLGYFVTESSEHQAEYTPYFIHHGEQIIRDYDVPIDEYLRRCESIISTWENTEKMLLGGDGEIVVEPQSHEYGSYIIHSLVTNEKCLIYGNVPNDEWITNLPSGCCVEVPCSVNGAGIQPHKMGDIPKQLAAICRTNINVQQLTVEAALTKQREWIYQAVMMDPHTSATLTLDHIWSMCDELIEAHQQHGFLPEYKRNFKSYGRSYHDLGETVVATLGIDKAFVDRKGALNELILKVENPSDDERDLAFEIVPEKPVFEWLSDQSQRVTVSPNSGSSHRFQFKNLEEVTESVSVELKCGDAKVFTLGSVLKSQLAIDFDENGVGEITTYLGGEVALKGELQCNADGLKFDFSVQDSLLTEANLKTREEHTWEGSWICLQIRVGLQESRPKRIVICPHKNGGGQAYTGIFALEDSTDAVAVKTILDAAKYTTEFIIPHSMLGSQPDEQLFMINVRSSIVALGDAHSGGISELCNEGNMAVFSRN